MVKSVQSHPTLTRVFVINLQKNQVTIAGVTFTISTDIIEATTGIPNVGEKWFKTKDLDAQIYEPYLKEP